MKCSLPLCFGCDSVTGGSQPFCTFFCAFCFTEIRVVSQQNRTLTLACCFFVVVFVLLLLFLCFCCCFGISCCCTEFQVVSQQNRISKLAHKRLVLVVWTFCSFCVWELFHCRRGLWHLPVGVWPQSSSWYLCFAWDRKKPEREKGEERKSFESSANIATTSSTDRWRLEEFCKECLRLSIDLTQFKCLLINIFRHRQCRAHKWGNPKSIPDAWEISQGQSKP